MEDKYLIGKSDIVDAFKKYNQDCLDHPENYKEKFDTSDECAVGQAEMLMSFMKLNKIEEEPTKTLTLTVNVILEDGTEIEVCPIELEDLQELSEGTEIFLELHGEKLVRGIYHGMEDDENTVLLKNIEDPNIIAGFNYDDITSVLQAVKSTINSQKA